MDSTDDAAGQDPTHRFLMQCHTITLEAQFIISSLPNADRPAVERVTHQLDAVRTIVSNLNDAHTTAEQARILVDFVSELLLPLEEFLSSPPPPANSYVRRKYTGRPGQPRYILDLDRALLLHGLGNTWAGVADAMGVTRQTMYNHLSQAGLSSARKEWSILDDEQLDEIVAEISLAHPFVGSTIVMGHLESRGIHLPRLRVQDSLRRVDAVGVLVRWAGIIRRRVYRVRGSNALWHQDGNEKLKPWGFWVHGCIDGHSRLIIYLVCCSNKRQHTVAALWKTGVETFGWPSRARGDFGTENNEIERMMIQRWGNHHRAYLRGRSLHNVRIERLWRDVRKDSLETFRQIFFYLEANQLLDMLNPIHKVCLFLVFHNRIQQSLDRTTDAWNHHKIRTEKNKTPIAIFELSREAAITRGYWTGDPGDPAEIADDPLYGHDSDAPLPPATDVDADSDGRNVEPEGVEEAREAGILTNSDAEIEEGRRLLADFDCDRDDGNWGIEVYCEAVLHMIANLHDSD